MSFVYSSIFVLWCYKEISERTLCVIYVFIIKCVYCVPINFCHLHYIITLIFVLVKTVERKLPADAVRGEFWKLGDSDKDLRLMVENSFKAVVYAFSEKSDKYSVVTQERVSKLWFKVSLTKVQRLKC